MLTFLDQCGLSYSNVSASILEKTDILEDCLDAIVNEEADYHTVSMASTYTHSIIFEFLENVKEALVKLAQTVLSALNNFFLNNVKIIDKYSDIICDNIRKLKEPIKQDTYEYPVMKDYPTDLKSTIGAEADIIRLHDKIRTERVTPNQISSQVNGLLKSFGNEVLKSTPDPFDLRESTEKIVRRTIEGRKITISITPETFNQYLNEIMNYKRDRDDILKTQKSILDDYNALKRTYSEVTKDPETLMRSTIQNLKDPDREAFIAHEYSRYNDIHTEMMRLFNGYITIYQAAFDTKLRCLNEKIDTNKAVINEIITRTGLFTSLNTKAANTPIPRDIATRHR